MFNIFSCDLEENMTFLPIKFWEVVGCQTWCIVIQWYLVTCAQQYKHAMDLMEQYAYNIASVGTITSRKESCRIYLQKQSVLCRTMFGNHSNSHVKVGSPCATVAEWILQSFSINGVLRAFTSWGAADLEAAHCFPRHILQFTLNFSIPSYLLPPLLSL